jgi:hypothetical protein
VAELIAAMVTTHRVIRFFRDLLPGHGPAPQLGRAFCGRMVLFWIAFLTGTGALAIFFYRDYLEKSNFIDGPWAGNRLCHEMLTILGYQYVCAIYFPLILGICGLGVWLYIYAYTRRHMRSDRSGRISFFGFPQERNLTDNHGKDAQAIE